MPDVTKQTVIRLLIITTVVLSSLAYTACAPLNAGHAENTPQTRSTVAMGKPGIPSPEVGARLPWNAVHSWAYWLNNPDLKQLGASPSDLLVIDYSADGSAAKAFSADQISQLRQKYPQRRVVAYLSIGQAESYRGYWQKSWRPGSPTWLGTEDPNWQGNYWVNYWEPAWQNVVYHYLDAIIAAGFDGIYLDRIDAYQENYAVGHEDDMVQFVAALAQYARAHAPLGEDFGIIAQNAEDLAARHPDYVGLVTGIAREEVYVQATNIATSPAARAKTESSLDLFLHNSRGKLVLTVDYATKPDLICEAYQHAQAKGYIPYVTQVGLDRLQSNPDC